MDWNIFFSILKNLGILLGLLITVITAFASIFWFNWRIYTSDVKNCSYLGEKLQELISIRKESLLWKIICEPLSWYIILFLVIFLIISIALLFSIVSEPGTILYILPKFLGTYFIFLLFGLITGHPNSCGGGGDM